MPRRRNKAKEKAPAGPTPHSITTPVAPAWGSRSEPAADFSNLVSYLRCGVRFFLRSLETNCSDTYNNHLPSFQRSLEAHLRNHYTSIQSDPTWQRILGWSTWHTAASARASDKASSPYTLPPAAYFRRLGKRVTRDTSGSVKVSTTWEDLGIVPEPGSDPGTQALEHPPPPPPPPPPRYIQPLILPPQTPQPTTASTFIRCGGGPTLSRRDPPQAVHSFSQASSPSRASFENVATDFRYHPRLSAPLMSSMNANTFYDINPPQATRWRPGATRLSLHPQSQFTISAEDDNGNDNDDDDAYNNPFQGSFGRQAPGTTPQQTSPSQHPPTWSMLGAPRSTATPARQPGPMRTHPTGLQSNLSEAITSRNLAEEASVLLELYSQSTYEGSESELRNRESMKTVLDSVNRIWDSLSRLDKGKQSSMAAASTSRCACSTNSGGTGVGSESEPTFNLYSGCIICCNAVADAVLMPCHHLVLCLKCCDRMGIKESAPTWGAGGEGAKCPVCRVGVTHRIKIYR